MRNIPLYNKVGEFGAFFDDLEELKQYYSVNQKVGNNIFYITSNLHENTGLNVKNISINEYNKYLNPKIPNWIKDKKIFEYCINKEFISILPQSAEIIPTMNCCFRCKQCAYRFVKEQHNIWDSNENNYSSLFNMDKETMKKVIDRLYEAKTNNVVFTGGGEPLYNSKVTLYGMRYAKEKGMNVGIYTNGLFLTSEIINEIIEIEPLFVRISIYGMDGQSFSNYTNSSSEAFYKIIKNIKILLKSKKNNNSNIQIILSFLLHPDLFPMVNVIDTFFDDYFNIEELRALSYIRFTPAVDYNYNRQHEYTFFKKIISKVDIISEKYAQYTNIVCYSHRFDDLYKKKIYQECYGSGFFAEISPNGDMYLCCEKLMNEEFIIGNIITDSVYDIYKSKKRKTVLENVNLNKCLDCPFLCKPHEINKQLNNLVNISNSEANRWRNEIINIASDELIYSGPLNAFES